MDLCGFRDISNEVEAIRAEFLNVRNDLLLFFAARRRFRQQINAAAYQAKSEATSEVFIDTPEDGDNLRFLFGDRPSLADIVLAVCTNVGITITHPNRELISRCF